MANVPPSEQKQETERFQFGLFLALTLHALLIFGVGFQWQKTARSADVLEYTLVTQTTEERPEDPDRLAQVDQLAGGKEDFIEEASTPHPNETEGLHAQEQSLASASMAELGAGGNEVLSSQQSTLDQVNAEIAKPVNPLEAQLLQTRKEISDLHAQLDQSARKQASLIRTATLSGIATAGSPEAEYEVRLKKRLEAVGTQNFPVQVIQQNQYGNPSVLISINPDGSTASLEIYRSSGYPSLDQAALEIAQMAAPFEPFPDELKQSFDRINYLRVWRFTRGGVLETELSE